MKVEEASELFKLIADPNRLTILRLLSKKLHMYANEMLPDLTCKQSTLSHHLSELTNSGLINSNKKGNKVIYSLNIVKYNQLTDFLMKVDRLNKKDNPIRVVDTKILNKKWKDEKLPTFLL